MRIILYEMKKIWNIKLLLIIALVCTLFYLIFMDFCIRVFPNGHSQTEEVDYSMQMTKLYGATLEADEFSNFMETQNELILEVESYIKANPAFSEVGIYSYADYEKVYANQSKTEAEEKAIRTLFGEKYNFVKFKLQALDNIKESYCKYPEYTLKYFISEAKSEKSIARLNAIKKTEEYRNIMSGWVFENTVTYTVYLAILAILAVLIFVSPLIVTDRTNNIHLLQYSAKQGRRILRKELIAVILSAFLLTTALILVFGGIYSTNGTFQFWNNGLTSFLNITPAFFWFDISYGQYIVNYIVLLYILCLGTAAIAFLLSRLSQNLITLILKLIPAFAILAALVFSIFSNTYSASNPLNIRTDIIGIEPIVCGLLLIVGLALSLYIVQREKKVDVI